MIDAHNYTITVRKGNFDGMTCYEARVAELPDVAEYGDSFEEAYSLAVDTIEMTAEMLPRQGKEMPKPLIPASDFSGRVTLRVPKTLHRALAQAADWEGVSLNQHIVNVLNYFSGYAQSRSSQIENEDWQLIDLPRPANPKYSGGKVIVMSSHQIQASC